LKLIALLVLLIVFTGCKTVSDDISSEFFNIGNAYYDVGEYDKAIEYYRRALSEGNDAENSIRYNLAVAYSESGRPSEGLEHFEFLLSLDSENLKILQSIAYAHYLLGDRELSLEYYNKILSIFEFESIALFNKAAMLIEENKDEAEKVLTKLYAIEPSVEVVLLLGSIYSEREEWDTYADKLELALIDNKNNPEILKGLLACYESSEQYDKFLAYIDELLLLENPGDLGSLYFRKAFVELLKIDDSGAGLKSLNDAVSNGFQDREKIKALVENEELVHVEQVEAFFKSRDLID